MRVYLLIILVFSKLLFASECEMHLEKIQNDESRFTLILTHDKNCEVIMDEHTSKIVLILKTVDHNISEPKHSKKDNTPIDKLINLAKSKLGDSYVYAATGPDHFDCSGFVYYVFKENGVVIPRTSLLQSKSTKKLNRQEIKRGDILSFDTHDRKHINHSGIYLGNGKFIHSSSGKAFGVTISDLDKGFYKDKFRWGVRKRL
ncbi:MAG: glycoside hydrolase [Sulfurovum sp.]|nr:MAG: glycoside hydrolase [Sulfurovum sp.]